MTKTYRELTFAEKMQTFKNYEKLCKEDESQVPYENFEEYDDDQTWQNFEFDAKTLEFLG